MHIRESGRAAELSTRPFLGLWLLVLVIPLIPELFACGGQVICVFGLSSANNLAEELQVNVRVAARCVGRGNDDLAESDGGVVGCVCTPNVLSRVVRDRMRVLDDFPPWETVGSEVGGVGPTILERSCSTVGRREYD